MSAAWLLYVLLVGVLMALAARVLATAAHAVGLPTRWVWACALAGVVVLAAVSPRRQLLQSSVSPSEVTHATPAATGASAPVDVVAQARALLHVVGDGATATLSSLAERVPHPLTIAFAAAWAVASVLLLVLFVTVNSKLARARRRWPASQAYGTGVRVAPNSGPAVLGLLRAEIVVPYSLLQRSAEEQRLIIAHEREHLRARDHLLLAAMWLVAIVLPWHPAVWVMLARLRLAIELDCDARVLRGGASRNSYGALLIDMAAHHGGIRIGALALADGPSHLERRILAMNTPRKRHAIAYGGLLCGLGTLLVLAACEAKMPTSAEIAQMDVASAEKSAAEAGFMRTPANDRTDFFLNGVPVSAERARAIEAKEIGSIEIVKSELPTGRDTIFVTSADRVKLPAKTPDSLEAARFGGKEYAFEQKKISEASSEKLVDHVARERAAERMRTSDAALGSKAPPPPPGPMRMKVRDGSAPIIMIDGKRSSEAQLAALDEKDIAAMAVYKSTERLDLASKGKSALEVTSAPSGVTPVPDGGSVISVTTKQAKTRARTQKQP